MMTLSRWATVFVYVGILIQLMAFFPAFVRFCVRYVPFHTEAVVLDKFCGSEEQKFMVDTSGRAYTIEDSKLLAFFKSSELFGNLQIGKRYRISGKGVRIPFFRSYPSITSASRLDTIKH